MTVLLKDLFKQQNPSPGNSTPEITVQNFPEYVIQASQQRLVMVQFWSARSPLCQQLSPILERITQSLIDKVTLVKVDVDQQPQIAAQFRIQTLPTVYLIYNGQPVDAFTGNLTESQILQMLAKFIAPTQSNPVEELRLHAQQAELTGNFEAAVSLYERILSQVQDPMTQACYIKGLIFLNQGEKAETLLRQLEPSPFLEPLINFHKLYQGLARLPKVDSLAQQVAKKPTFANQLNYAKLLFLQRNFEQAVALLFQLSPQESEEVKTVLILFFDILGASHAITQQGRRQLARLLFS